MLSYENEKCLLGPFRKPTIGDMQTIPRVYQ